MEDSRRVFDSVPVGLHRTTPGGQFVEANLALVHMLGYPDRETLLATNAKDLYEDPEAHRRRQDLLDQQGVVRDFEARLRRPDGAVIWVRESAQVVRDESDLPLYHEGVMEDITERRQIDEAWRQGEAHYRSLFDGVPVGINRTTPAGQILDANLALVEMLGYPNRETLLTTGVADTYANLEDRKRWQTLIEREGTVRDFEVQMRCYDGTIIWAKSNARAVRDADGRVLYYQGSLEDITERKRAETALRRLKEFNESIVQNMTEGIAVEDADGYFTFVNPAAETLLGYAPGELVGQHWTVVVPPDQHSIVQAADERRVRGEADQYELELVHRDGARLSVLVAGSPRFEGERFVGTLAVFTDITVRKQAEEALRESEEKYRTILDNIEDGYFEVDIAGNFTFFNDALCRIIGYSRAEMMGMNNRQYMDQVNARKVYQAFNHVYTTGEPTKGFDWELARRDGTKRAVEASVSLIRDVEGAPFGFRGIARDITARKQAEEALRQSEEFSRAVLENSPVGVSVRSRTGRLLSYNEAWRKIWAVPDEVLIADLVRERDELVFDKRDSYLGPHLDAVRQLYESGGVLHLPELQVVRPRPGGACWVNQYFYAITDQHGDIDRVVILTENITQRKEAEAERARLLAAEREQRELAETLREVASVLNASLDREQVLQLILEQLARVVDYDSASVILVVGGVPRFAAHRGIRSLEQLVDPEQIKARPHVRQVLEQRVPVIISDTATDPEWLHRPCSEYIRSWLGVPLVAPREDEAIGLLNLDKEQPNFYAARHADLAVAFAAQAAIAIENAWLYEEVRARSRYLETLQRINATLRSTLSLGEVLETIARGTGEALGYVGAIIAIPDAPGERLILGAAWGRRFLDTAIRFTGRKMESFSLPLTAMENAMAQAYLSGELQAWSQAPERIVVGVEPPISRRLALLIERAMGTKLVVCAPLPAGQTVLGVLVGFSPRERLPDEERAMLLGLADQAGLAIENAQLFAETQAAYERLKQTQAQLIQSAKMAAIGQLAAGVAHEINNPMTSVLGFAELLLRNSAPDDPKRNSLTVIVNEARRVREIVSGLLSFARQTEFCPEWADVSQVVRETLDLVRQRLSKGGIVVEEHYAPDLPFLQLDISRMKQVFLNLIVNALHAMPQGGSLTVVSELVGPEVVVRIADSGVGIPAANLPRIFDPFFTTQPVGQGTGLGLSISLGIVQDHGGRIEVESQVGRGSTFTVCLPARTGTNPSFARDVL